MITLKLTVPVGDIEISGQTASEVHANLQQLLGSDDLILAWGNVKKQLEDGTQHLEAVSNAGSILGAEQVGYIEQYDFNNLPLIMLPDGNHAEIQKYVGEGPKGAQSKALWYGTEGEVTDNPSDMGIITGQKRLWIWVD